MSDDFHDAFARALLKRPSGSLDHMGTFAEQVAFDVYRNTVVKGCVDALEANFPAVVRLVGSEWFRSAASAFARSNPPRDARMLLYGDDGFPTFLGAIPTAQTLPYLEGVARLDVLWRQAHAAADAEMLAPATLAAESPQQLATRVLRVHPAARWAWFAHHPVPSIWSRNRSRTEHDLEISWRGEGLLLTRPDAEVLWVSLGRDGCVFLEQCRLGVPLGEAAQAAVEAEPLTDLSLLLPTLVRAGAFAAEA